MVKKSKIVLIKLLYHIAKIAQVWRVFDERKMLLQKYIILLCSRTANRNLFKKERFSHTVGEVFTLLSKRRIFRSSQQGENPVNFELSDSNENQK